MKTCFRITALLAALAMLLAVCGCGSENDKLDAIIREKKIVFGIAPESLPISSYNDGEASGMSVQIGNEIAARLNVRAEYICVPQSEALQYINDGTIDCYINLAVSDIRTAAQIQTVDTGLKCRQVAVVTSWSKCSRLVDLTGERVCVISGSDACAALDEAQTFRSALGGLEFSEDHTAIMRELTGSTCAAAIVDELEFLYAAGEARSKFVVIEEPLASGSYVLAFGYRDTSLCGRIQSIFDDMTGDGTLGRIKSNWIG